ncbi:GNAT family N-acetyltransferase [Thalassobius sp. S69A]|uniref:GNAT family N-acetyltransferase n=1 Tax=unclassified Thalassovita TaxID=2619711 RepID=UPI000C0ED433|nr:GNAT family N-acetyltransferase [Paracoccaceae bacterium]MBT25770.1 GNAT family N-acetyltransferase [Paracoccaceae bacterium]
MQISQWTANDLRTEIEALTEILYACVYQGASVGFILPHPKSEARAFWSDIATAVGAGDRALFVATQNGRPVGTAQLVLATPANQPHRAEVSKVLVHPQARRQGVARALMHHLETYARAAEKTLLTLDTRTGDMAEPLYLSLGFQKAGVIPGYCLAPSGQIFDSTSYMYKQLSQRSLSKISPTYI